MKKLQKLKIVITNIALSLIILSISGCASLVDTSQNVYANLQAESTGTAHFYIPISVRTITKDYHDITNKQFSNTEDIENAKMQISNSPIHGYESDSFLCVQPNQAFFYVTQLNTGIDLMNASRDDVLSLFNKSGLTFINYGRMIVNTDELPKAVMRVDFSVKDNRGASYGYNGYVGVADLHGSWYMYVAGYSNATEKQLKECFNCVRSLN